MMNLYRETEITFPGNFDRRGEESAKCMLRVTVPCRNNKSYLAVITELQENTGATAFGQLGRSHLTELSARRSG